MDGDMQSNMSNSACPDGMMEQVVEAEGFTPTPDVDAFEN